MKSKKSEAHRARFFSAPKSFWNILGMSLLVLVLFRVEAPHVRATQDSQENVIRIGDFRIKLLPGWERAPQEVEKEWGAWLLGDTTSERDGRTLIVSFSFETTDFSSESEKAAILRNLRDKIQKANPRTFSVQRMTLAGSEFERLGFEQEGTTTFYLTPSFGNQIYMIMISAVNDRPQFPVRAQELLETLELGQPLPRPAPPAPSSSTTKPADSKSASARTSPPATAPVKTETKVEAQTLTAWSGGEILIDENAVLDVIYEGPSREITADEFHMRPPQAGQAAAAALKTGEWLAVESRPVPPSSIDKPSTEKLADPCPSLPLPDKLPALSSSPPVPEELALDLSKSINTLGRTQYQGMVCAAMEASRLLVGPLSQDDEKRFLQAWAPAFSYTSDRLLAYFERLNPLLVEFLGLVQSVQAGLAQMDQIQYEAEMAAAYENEPAAREAMAEAGRCAAELKALKARVSDIASKASALGPPPDPRLDLCDARRRTKKSLEEPEAPKTSGPAPGGFLAWLAQSGLCSLSFRASFPAEMQSNPNPFWDERWMRSGEMTSDGRTFLFTSQDDTFGELHCANRKERNRTAMRFEVEGVVGQDEQRLDRLAFKVIFHNCVAVRKPGV